MKEKNQTNQPVLVPDEAMFAVGSIRQQIADLEGHFRSYLTGLRQGLGVPENWQLDLQAKAFVPPEKGEKPD